MNDKPTASMPNESDTEDVELRCPQCQGELERIRRKTHMRLLLGSRRYRCLDCRQEFLRYMNHMFRV